MNCPSETHTQSLKLINPSSQEEEDKVRVLTVHVEMGFLRRATGISLRDKVRSSLIHEGLREEQLLLCIERR